ncbi:hypothetical protein LHK_01028 [Laribacter hongkongensis HLHK9]|uniref:Uncharacterized protein n=1 Tax=Laribacter hongkongensis (strain HLHK9) TaxID=557598 RepID=C1D5Y9_LARHH|nr:hypothetical protein LHK_01028 [Laribacter hongkongensis HLHK9]
MVSVCHGNDLSGSRTEGRQNHVCIIPMNHNTTLKCQTYKHHIHQPKQRIPYRKCH